MLNFFFNRAWLQVEKILCRINKIKMKFGSLVLCFIKTLYLQIIIIIMWMKMKHPNIHKGSWTPIFVNQKCELTSLVNWALWKKKINQKTVKEYWCKALTRDEYISFDFFFALWEIYWNCKNTIVNFKLMSSYNHLDVFNTLRFLTRCWRVLLRLLQRSSNNSFVENEDWM